MGVPKDVGAGLQARRKELGLRQADLAESIGVSRGYVAILESGTDSEPSDEILTNWARALGWEPDAILKMLGRQPRRALSGDLGTEVDRLVEERIAEHLPTMIASIADALGVDPSKIHASMKVTDEPEPADDWRTELIDAFSRAVNELGTAPHDGFSFTVERRYPDGTSTPGPVYTVMPDTDYSLRPKEEQSAVEGGERT